MSDVVVYQNADSTIGIIAPAPGVTAAQAASGVPAGLSSVIVAASSLPADKSTRSAWRVNLSTSAVTVDAAALLEAQRAAMVVSRFQAKEAMQAAGILATVETAVTTAGGTALRAWNEAVEFRRTSPTINSLKAAVGLTDAQIDALFIAAAGIEA